MHWSLDQVREMDADEFDELVAWAIKRTQKDEDGSVDMDAVIAAKTVKDAQDE